MKDWQMERWVKTRKNNSGEKERWTWRIQGDITTKPEEGKTWSKRRKLAKSGEV